MTIKSPSQGDRWGIEVMLPKGGHETGALAWGDPTEGQERRLEQCWSWGQLSVQQHMGTPMTTHRLEPMSLQTINIFPSCSYPRP